MSCQQIICQKIGGRIMMFVGFLTAIGGFCFLNLVGVYAFLFFLFMFHFAFSSLLFFFNFCKAILAALPLGCVP